MRYVIIGAGAVGGVIGGRLFEHGHDVTLVARGENYHVLARSGLRLDSPQGTAILKIPVADSPRSVKYLADDVVILATKSQDSSAPLRELASTAPDSVAVVCAQNGVENERVSLRLFANTYAMCVMCPCAHITAGVVQLHAGPSGGVFDLGRWPKGDDDTAREIAHDFEISNLHSRCDSEIALLKWGKLISNLFNSIEAICGGGSGASELGRRLLEESHAVLTAAGVDVIAAEAAAAKRASLVNYQPLDGQHRGGGSSWQSLTRGVGDIETDYLNGEIVLLGRLHGVATPVNQLLQHRANQMAQRRQPPGSVSESELLAELL